MKKRAFSALFFALIRRYRPFFPRSIPPGWRRTAAGIRTVPAVPPGQRWGWGQGAVIRTMGVKGISRGEAGLFAEVGGPPEVARYHASGTVRRSVSQPSSIRRALEARRAARRHIEHAQVVAARRCRCPGPT